MTTVSTLLQEARKNLSLFECELLIAYAIGVDRVTILTHPEQLVDEHGTQKFFECIRRRTNHEPIAYITGKKEFYGREFFVDKHTLIPRPETELIIDSVCELFNTEKNFERNNSFVIMDIGTGSGNILITIAKEYIREKNNTKNISFIGTDISHDTLLIAEKNARYHNIDTLTQFILSDLLENIPKTLFQQSQSIIITANLPYIAEKSFLLIPSDVRDYEPKTALVSGIDGLDHYRKLLKEVCALKKNQNITLFLEVDPIQESPLCEYTKTLFNQSTIDFSKDLSGTTRMAHICTIATHSSS